MSGRVGFGSAGLGVSYTMAVYKTLSAWLRSELQTLEIRKESVQIFILYISFNKADEKSDTGSRLRTVGKFGNKKGSSSMLLLS